MRLIPKIFIFDEEEVPPELRAQRTLNRSRIPEMANYLVDNREDYTLSAITASVNDQVHFEPLADTGVAVNLGLLSVPMDAQILINDGQHRRAAIEEAIRNNSELGHDNIPVLFFIDDGLKRSQQMFADLNKHAVRPNDSLSTLYDWRDPSSSMSRYIVDTVACFKKLTEMEKSSISNRSIKLFALSSIKLSSRSLLRKSAKDPISEEEMELAALYWQQVTEAMPDWKDAKSRSVLYDSIDSMLEDIDSLYAGRPLKDLVYEIQQLYLYDDKPWVIGFSGGKDSTTILSLTYTALLRLQDEGKELHKHIYVVSSDTLVETPVVVDQIKFVIDAVNNGAREHNLPLSAHQVFPKTGETFWANLLGKGYPAPTTSFRWCTERMKIDPVSEFIMDKVTQFGEVIVVLGSRSQESSSRAQVIAKHKIDGSLLARHTSLPGAFTYMPIESWTHDEVWMYLLATVAPWGGNNRELFDLYKGSNAGECPLVIDKSTPSCGNSRFGCWTCMVVTKDKAIEELIENDAGVFTKPDAELFYT